MNDVSLAISRIQTLFGDTHAEMCRFSHREFCHIIADKAVMICSYATNDHVYSLMRLKSVLLIITFTIQPVIASVQQLQPVHGTCVRIADKLSSVNLDECLARQLADSGRLSENNTPLLLKEYPPLESRAPQARILMLGGVHGDEYSSVTIMFKWMGILDQHHSGLFHWKIAPLVNPDGLLQDKSQRMNANGVDLNRNFPNGSHRRASLEYWEKRAWKDPRRYPGEHPMSEVETRWMHELIENFKPHAIIAVHAPYGIVDFDGPPKPPAHLGPLHLHLLGTYPGSLGNFAGEQLNIPVVTVELPYAGIMPSDREIRRIWVDLVAWLIHNVPKRDRLSRQQDDDPVRH